MEVIVRNKVIADIPLLELHQNEAGVKKPMVFLYHGYLGRKEFTLAQAYFLASQGFFVVVPDAYGHGDRNSDKFIDLLVAVTKSAEEINTLIESYRDHDQADNTKAGLAGYSMGGMITFLYLTLEEKRIQAAVPVISTPDWASIVDGFQTREKLDELKGYGIIKEDEDLQEYRKAAAQMQPLNKYESMKDIPLLMLCGEQDAVTPYHGVKGLYERLQPIFFDKEALKYIVYPGIGHGDTVEMNVQLAEWMKKYLVNG